MTPLNLEKNKGVSSWLGLVKYCLGDSPQYCETLETLLVIEMLSGIVRENIDDVEKQFVMKVFLGRCVDVRAVEQTDALLIEKGATAVPAIMSSIIVDNILSWLERPFYNTAVWIHQRALERQMIKFHSVFLKNPAIS